MLGAALPGCATEDAQGAMRARDDAAALRELQTRRFEGIEEDRLLAAAVAVLQDLGFTIRLSNARLGFAKGVKDREAKAPDQVAAVVLLMLLASAGGGAAPSMPPMQQEQTITALLVTRPLADGARGQALRVSFHRYLRQPLLLESGVLREPQLYERFFELLSKAIFLEAHRL
ncbi:MAG TPA: hypothetical protein VJ789_02300 [Burkholderiales bacterium]|nr:hypothetical protein [Burkholderiales bacterium]